ncbi:MAG: hypothetical protein A2Y24_06015 [Clostridiales bacterium GWE2_32_10]|nr:MAG: hypothetical protein A2Y24_06015 [Clostridiales bacterium GWE2_32_10]HBY20857.1 hypothetical protein [Clostridiales bacterium]
MTEEIYKLTHPQLGIWNVELFHHKTSVNNIVGTVKYEKEIKKLKQLFTSDEIDSICKHIFNLLVYAILHSERKIYFKRW